MQKFNDIEWFDLKGYEGLYMISKNGEVLSLNYYRPNKLGKLFASETPAGYKFYRLTKNNETKQIYAHRLVAETFIPKHDENLEVNHLDGDKGNNHVSNLEWCTRSQNIQHSYDMGRVPAKYPSHRRTLTNDEVLSIRAEYIRYKVTQKALAEKYGVSPTTIFNVVNKRFYKEI